MAQAAVLAAIGQAQPLCVPVREHGHQIAGVEYTVPDDDIHPDRPVEDDRRWRLDAVVTEPGRRFSYRYDFGDDWRHEVVVEAIGAPVAGVVYPRVTAGRRRCPTRGLRRAVGLR